MKTEATYPYIEFISYAGVPDEWKCQRKRGKQSLGNVKWHSDAECFVFYFEDDVAEAENELMPFTDHMLMDIADFIIKKSALKMEARAEKDPHLL